MHWCRSADASPTRNPPKGELPFRSRLSRTECLAVLAAQCASKVACVSLQYLTRMGIRPDCFPVSASAIEMATFLVECSDTVGTMHPGVRSNTAHTPSSSNRGTRAFAMRTCYLSGTEMKRATPFLFGFPDGRTLGDNYVCGTHH
jgi:hypothetical protein